MLGANEKSSETRKICLNTLEFEAVKDETKKINNELIRNRQLRRISKPKMRLKEGNQLSSLATVYQRLQGPPALNQGMKYRCLSD